VVGHLLTLDVKSWAVRLASEVMVEPTIANHGILLALGFLTLPLLLRLRVPGWSTVVL